MGLAATLKRLLRPAAEPDASLIRVHSCPWKESDLPGIRERGGLAHTRSDLDDFLRDYLKIGAHASTSLVGSGRSALRLALEVLAAEHPGKDTVVMPSYCCKAVEIAVADPGLRPRFVDIGPDLNATVEQQIAAIDERTLAVVMVNTCGKSQDPLEQARLIDHLRRRGVIAIEDNCHNFVATPGEAQADMSFYSFAFSKSLNATAGGFLVSNLLQGQIQARLAQYQPQNPTDAETRFRHYAARYNTDGPGPADDAPFRHARSEYGPVPISDIDLALAAERTLTISASIGRQQSNGLRLQAIMARHSDVYATQGAIRNIFTRSSVILKDVETFNRFWNFMTERGIELEGMYAPLHLAEDAGPTLPVTEAVYQRVFNIPNRADLTEGQIARISRALSDFPKTLS